ncbi:hypothetical protein N8D56_10420 [Devosia sp. A8/3-2]|nr:hypothetical protein N8D56_10420 [Devosia sp. A8/3-2]
MIQNCIFASALLIASGVGYLDDSKPGGLSELTLGLTDLAIALFVCVVLMNGGNTEIWLPFTSAHFTLPRWGGVLLYTPVVWLCINAVNCNDGVDGVSGTLSSLTICVLGFLLYFVVGDVNNAEIPADPVQSRCGQLGAGSGGILRGDLGLSLAQCTAQRGADGRCGIAADRAICRHVRRGHRQSGDGVFRGRTVVVQWGHGARQGRTDAALWVADTGVDPLSVS